VLQRPSPALTSTERACYGPCMEKYMAGWNGVRGAVFEHVAREQKSAGV
jgi:hypothetical protein